MTFRTRTGLVTGRNHLLDAGNCQDALRSAYVERDMQSYYYGVLADGCGSGQYSEVGAQLTVQFVLHTLTSALQADTPVEDVPVALFNQVIAFLKSLVQSYGFTDSAQQTQFIYNHLLCTLVGFIVTPEQTLVFASGDGIVVLNDTIHQREQHNTPAYIGYHLVEQHPLRPESFDCYQLPTSELQRLAIGSDAWLQELPLLAEVWNQNGAASLQLRMNRWSHERHFKDDASMVLIERITIIPEDQRAAPTKS